MKEHFLTYEQSLAVKELGFDEPCLKMSEHRKLCPEQEKPDGCQLHNLHCGYPDCTIDKTITPIPLPLKSQFFKWVRDNHDIDYSILPESSSGHKLIDRTFNVVIYRYIMNVNVQAEILRIDNKNIARYMSREQAEDAVINKIIEILKLK